LSLREYPKLAACTGSIAVIILTTGIVNSKKDIKLAFVTCTVNSRFFEPLKKGMTEASEMLGVRCDFIGTEGVDVVKQAEIVRQAANSGYDGIAVNIIDPEAFDEVIQEVMDRGIPVVAFNIDDQATPNARLSSVNQNLYKAGQSLAEHLLAEIPENARVLMTMHDRGISALEDRLNGMQSILKKKNVEATVVIPGNDSAKGAEVIAAALKENPDIRIILATGQSDTEAAGTAIEKYFNDKGHWAAGFDLSPKTLELIKAGHIRCTVDQQPYIQGFYPVVQLTQYLRYGIKPSDIDAGAAIIDKSNIDQVMELTKQGYR
jgi:simple sugar transport system substrate-binding protein